MGAPAVRFGPSRERTREGGSRLGAPHGGEGEEGGSGSEPHKGGGGPGHSHTESSGMSACLIETGEEERKMGR
jgi:hypothetical protein